MTAILDNRVPPPLVCLACGVGMYFTARAAGESTLVFASQYGLGLAWLCLSLILIVMSIRQFKQHQTTVNPAAPQSSQPTSHQRHLLCYAQSNVFITHHNLNRTDVFSWQLAGIIVAGRFRALHSMFPNLSRRARHAAVIW